jgi:hypothetical protein
MRNGVVKFYPLKVYCFKSIICELERILQREGIPDKCEEWRQYTSTSDGGRIYDFQNYDGKRFLNNERNLGLMMNLDWFQPFDNRSDYSVGVIYFVVLNLPRDIRFKIENVIVAGIMPALAKEPKSLEYFFGPIVTELKALWKGVPIQTSLSPIQLTYRAALLCVAADLPAARKACGFKSHAAKKGCHRCYKTFPGGFGEKRNFGGFDRENWNLRTKQQHNVYANQVKKSKTVAQFNRLSRDYGTYYSVLIELEYFDAVRFCAIDGMHNLFLGTAKHMYKLWTSRDILNKQQLATVINRINEIEVPTDIGRCPSNIVTNHGNFSAAEWKHWATTFSAYALHDILPHEDFRCWEKFILACQLLSRPFLTHTDILKADALLINFCKQVETLYGSDVITPNMHLHCHLRECLLDFGPLQSFWCFPFERYNGYLGSFSINNKTPEVQFMRKINVLRHAQGIQFPEKFRDVFAPFFDPPRMKKLPRVHIGNILKLNLSRGALWERVDWCDYQIMKFPLSSKVCILSSQDDMQFLHNLYQRMYSGQGFGTTIAIANLSEVIQKFGSIHIAGQRFGSKMESRTLRSARVLAGWAIENENGEILIDDFRPCRVNYYFSHILTLGGSEKRHYFANVSWYVSYENRNAISQACEVWNSDRFEPGGIVTFLPVQLLHSRFASAIPRDGPFMGRMIVAPIPRSVSS